MDTFRVDRWMMDIIALGKESVTSSPEKLEEVNQKLATAAKDAPPLDGEQAVEELSRVFAKQVARRFEFADDDGDYIEAVAVSAALLMVARKTEVAEFYIAPAIALLEQTRRRLGVLLGSNPSLQRLCLHVMDKTIGNLTNIAGAHGMAQLSVWLDAYVEHLPFRVKGAGHGGDPVKNATPPLKEEIRPLLEHLVGIGQRRHRNEMSHQQVLSESEAIGTTLKERVAAMSPSDRQGQASTFAGLGVTKRFEAVANVFDIEEALLVGTAVLAASQEVGSVFFLRTAQAYADAVLLVALPANTVPEIADQLMQEVANVVVAMKAEVEERPDAVAASWLEQWQ